jgi:hypothetical protein
MHGSAASQVMIATHENTTETPGQINNLIGICAIANNIAEIPDGIILRSSGKNGLEGRKIGMDVGDDKGAHLSLSVSFWLYVHLSKQAVIVFSRQ